MAASDDGLIQPGYLKINSITISSTQSNQSLDIKTIIEEFAIHENIMQPYMSANFLVTDATSLFTLLPLTGDEFVDFDAEIPHPAFTKKLKLRFRVVSIQDVLPSKEVRNIRYIIRCLLPEAFKDWTTKIRDSYTGIPVSDMVKKLTSEYLGISEAGTATVNPSDSGNMQLRASSSLGPRTIVIPNLTPAESLMFLCRESKALPQGIVASANSAPVVTPPGDMPSNFVFYSNADGYFFKTVEEMLAQLPTDKYFLTEKNYFPNNDPACPSPGILGRLHLLSDPNVKLANKPFEFMKVYEYKFLNIFDLEKNLRSGVFDTMTFIIDPTIAKFEKKTYNYTQDYDRFQRTDKDRRKFIFQNSELGKLKGFSHQRYIMTDKDSNATTPDTKADYLHLLAASVSMLDYVTLEITIPGDPGRRVGDIIRLGFPEFSAFDETIGLENAFLAGDYLVASVQHNFSITDDKGYKCIIQCMKNTYNRSPEEATKPLSKGAGGKDDTLPVPTDQNIPPDQSTPTS